jgi:hypothetical protein
MYGRENSIVLLLQKRWSGDQAGAMEKQLGSERSS